MLWFGANMLNLPTYVSRIESEAKIRNMSLFAMVFNQLSNLAISRFEWEGLPETCNERMMEIVLYFYGKELFFNDPELGYLNLAVNLTGNQNVYYEFLKREAFSINYHKDYTIDNSVLIRNNYTMTPTVFPVIEYSSRISDALRTIDTHIFHIKNPYFVRTNKKEVLSMKNVYKQIGDNEVAVYPSESFASKETPFEVIKTDVQFMGKELWEHVRNLYSEVYTLLGINNSNTDKRERLIVDEVNSNNMVIDMNVNTQYDMRKRACEEINKMFGLNVDVKMKTIRDFEESYTVETEDKDYV